MMDVTELKLLQKSRTLEVGFTDGEQYSLPCEYLRVYSPSAQVRGHGKQDGTLQTGKRSVNIIAMEPVGQYAIKLVFDDGHDSGLYTWEYLHELAVNYPQKWQNYLDQLQKAGKSRDV